MLSPEDVRPIQDGSAEHSRRAGSRPYAWLVTAAFLAGLLSSYLAWGRGPAVSSPAPLPSTPVTATRPATARPDVAALMQQIDPPQGYKLPAQYGDLGPRLLAGGAIDYGAFAAVFHVGGINFFNDKQAAIDEMIRVAAPGAKILIADETEKGARGYEQFIPGFKRSLGGRRSAITAPIELVPSSMLDRRVFDVWKGWLYCIEFRKPPMEVRV